MKIKLSAKCLTHRFECNLEHILGKCGGRCCRCVNFFWPPKAFSRLGHCGYLTATGCEMKEDERPLDCLLYPLMWNDHFTLVLHNRTLSRKGICRGANGGRDMLMDQPTILHALNTICQPFTDDMRESILAGKDVTIDLSPEIECIILREKRQTEQLTPPVSRKVRWIR